MTLLTPALSRSEKMVRGGVFAALAALAGALLALGVALNPPAASAAPKNDNQTLISNADSASARSDR